MCLTSRLRNGDSMNLRGAPQDRLGLVQPYAWEKVCQALSDGLIITDGNFIVCFVNRAYGDLSGRSVQEIIGQPCYVSFPGPMCHTQACPLRRIQSGDQRVIYENTDHCKGMGSAPCMVTANRIEADPDQPSGMVERFTDISALKQAQDELHKSHEQMRKNMGAIIQAMSMTIEKRDPYTAGHQRRVAKLCRAIATELGFSWERIQGLRMAAAIHDLGKILVPAAILNKPGAMSEHELAIIRLHPRMAYDILKGIKFPWPLAQTIYQHHERLDGSGYPRQLKGEAILLEARILAVADVVESMASFRPYRQAVGLQPALQELRTNRGILYDEKVVDACLMLITEKGFDFETKTWQRYIRPAGSL